MVSLEQVDFQRWNLDGKVDEAIIKLALAMSLPQKATTKKAQALKAKVEEPVQTEKITGKEQSSETEVDVREQPPTFAKEDISELFFTAAEIADEDPEEAYFLYQRVIEIDPKFMMGRAQEFITRESERLKPARIANMLAQAKEENESW